TPRSTSRQPWPWSLPEMEIADAVESRKSKVDLQLRAQFGRSQAQDVAALAVVAVGLERQDQEVLGRDQAHQCNHLVGVDAHLAHRAGLQLLRSVLQLGEDVGELHPGAGQIQLVR